MVVIVVVGGAVVGKGGVGMCLEGEPVADVVVIVVDMTVAGAVLEGCSGDGGRGVRCGVFCASCSVHARALRRRIREASLTRRLKRGSVARVRKVSLRILA